MVHFRQFLKFGKFSKRTPLCVVLQPFLSSRIEEEKKNIFIVLLPKMVTFFEVINADVLHINKEMNISHWISWNFQTY